MWMSRLCVNCRKRCQLKYILLSRAYKSTITCVCVCETFFNPLKLCIAILYTILNMLQVPEKGGTCQIV